jgi:translation elongation factor EF-Tu-like GTPase
LPENEGGRTKAIQSGYRPSFGFNTEKRYSGEIALIGTDEINPGQTGKATVRLLPAKTIRRNLRGLDAFTICEGEKIIGIGLILVVDISAT